ncbi:DUF421 domain-containing protein [Larkinella terrae]|uniref:DUF421 domain-containing protein n=1 Tax=Larkinella terrae TaxID=2025311 RepID=A0A7K0EKZ5_9BACT|nr:YetF domain-containing protein [Larkinella terrae]MRS62523.1 DUF421 domain-containing protein [Larkinella terrae]
MEKIFGVNWESVFIPTTSVLEMIIRGTLTYWFIFVYLRIFRRGTGQLNLSDLLLITMISDAAQNAMAGPYESVTEGLFLVGTLVFWDYLIDWLGYRSVFLKRIVEPDPVLLVKNGQLMRQNMKKEMISEDELISILRENGVEDYHNVKMCYLEGSGNVSVIEKK